MLVVKPVLTVITLDHKVVDEFCAMGLLTVAVYVEERHVVNIIIVSVSFPNISILSRSGGRRIFLLKSH